MSLRYYPSFRVKTDLITNGSQYRTSAGPYKGKYYLTYDGRAFTGPNPIVGPNEELFSYDQYIGSLQDHSENPISDEVKTIVATKDRTNLKKVQAKR